MKRSGWEVQCASVMALFLREMRTRFGEFRLGYIWAVLEPAAHIVIMLMLFGLLMKRSMPDISYPVFLINGVVPWMLFNNIATRSLGAIEANAGLFNYRPVKPIDTLIARTVVESLISGQLYVTLMLFAWGLGEPVQVNNISKLFFVMLLLVVLSFGFGLVLMVVGDVSKELGKIVTLALKPLYFISGIMIPMRAFPVNYYDYILWNPVIHAIELGRNAVSINYDASHVDFSYLSLATLVMLFLGLVLYRYREEDMLRS